MSAPDWSLYPYDPSKALPIVFAILTVVLAITHGYLSFVKYRWRLFGAVVTWGSLVWLVGFTCRAYTTWHVQDIDVFIVQYVLILAGPPIFAASEYWILERLLSYLPYHSPMHPGRVVHLFLLLSSAVEALTGTGASGVATNYSQPDKQATGFALLKAALILQASIEVVFSSFVAYIQIRCKRAGHLNTSINTVCATLYLTSAMLLVRCIVRAIGAFGASHCKDLLPGACGVVTTHEWFLWVFEVANISIMLLVLAIWHPGKYLPNDRAIYLDPADGKTERLGPGPDKVKRPLFLKFLDPFNFAGSITGYGYRLTPYWRQEQPVYHGDEKAGALISVAESK